MRKETKITIVRPGDKATLYLNPYFLNFSRQTPWDRSQGDYIWLPDNPGYQIANGVPEGLRIRTQDEMTNIGSAALLEVQKGGYELDELVCVPLSEPKFEEMLQKLDSGGSQMLITYTSMLPIQYVENGIPTVSFLERARSHNWRIALISLFADPYSFGMFWKSEYVPFGKSEGTEGVLVTITDPSLV